MGKSTDTNPLFRIEGLYKSQDPSNRSTGGLLIALMREFESFWNYSNSVGLEGKLTSAEFNVVACINSGKTQVSEIAREMGITKQAVSKSVISLKKRGLLEFSKHDSDARSKVLSLTEKGQMLMKKALSKASEIEAMYASTLGPKELDQMKLCLSSLIESHRKSE